MTFGSLFSGVGGMDLGLERAGLRCVWQSEIDPHACRVLARHWPGVPNLGDVTRIDWGGVERPDLICGGFPCQDISFAGRGAGLAGARSGLWHEFARAVREVRPRLVLVENVAALLVRGLDAVLGTLASLRYDAEWSIFPACALGAPHSRERLFIVAHADGLVRQAGMGPLDCVSYFRPQAVSPGDYRESHQRWLDSIARADRSLDGISARMDRLRGLGNAVVPQVAEWIGRLILASDHGP